MKIVLDSSDCLGPLPIRYGPLDRYTITIPEDYPKGPRDVDDQPMVNRDYYIVAAEVFDAAFDAAISTPTPGAE